MSKKLVSYFSASGVTAELAANLAAAIGADLYEIRPQIPYTPADLDWTDVNARSTVEMKNQSFRPPLADTAANIAEYDVIFIGFPIWWYVAPTIINTFLESYDFSGKRLITFATSGGSGFGQTLEKLLPSASDTAVWKEGRLFPGKASQAVLADWVEGLNI